MKKEKMLFEDALIVEQKDFAKFDSELIFANRELAFQIQEKEDRAAELLIANVELAFQNKEKENRASELIIANKELAFQNLQKEKRASELYTANKELAFQNQEKENRAYELLIANKELAFQNQEKENRAAELLTANQELAFQNQEKENRAAELLIANKELAFQNTEKEKRAAELLIANKELAFQNQEKENRAAELLIANKELAFQNQEKENRASELLLANQELALQNQEKENLASELFIANEELAFQNLEREKRANELLRANKDLETFAFISSHDLQEPLRKIQGFANRVIAEESQNLSEKGQHYFERICSSALRMQTLLNDLLVHSRSTERESNIEKIDFNDCVTAVLSSKEEVITENDVLVTIAETCTLTVIPFQFRQMLQNLLSNAIKFRKPNEQLQINISCGIAEKADVTSRNLPSNTNYSYINISDTGIGFDEKYKEIIFEMFRRLNDNNLYSGTGIGLTIVQKIVENHNGYIFASGNQGEGATFELYLPLLSEIIVEN